MTDAQETIAENQADTKKTSARIIKKYPNRRLYDKKQSCYITTDDIRKIVSSGEEVKVIDSKTGREITRGILMQIINEREEQSAKKMFSNTFLAQVIKSYGTDMQNTLVLCFERALEFYFKQTAKKTEPEKSPFKMDAQTYFTTVARDNINNWRRSWDNLKSKK